MDGFVLARLQRQTRRRLDLGTRCGAVTSPHFAIDDRRLQRLLGVMIGCGNRLGHQKQEPAGQVLVQVLGEPRILFVESVARGQSTQTLSLLLVSTAVAVQVGLRLVELIPHSQRTCEQIDHLLRKFLAEPVCLVTSARCNA